MILYRSHQEMTMLLPEMHLSSTEFELDDAAYIEIQVWLNRGRVHNLDWDRLVERVGEITLHHTGGGFKPEGTPACHIGVPVLGTAMRAISLRASSPHSQFDEENVEPYREAIGRMLGEEYGMDRARIIIQRY